MVKIVWLLPYLFALFMKCDANNTAPSVIIIGAGAAGIAAASKLLQNNISNIIILEAEDRIGGRIHSVKFGDSMVDLGAQWCQGELSIVYHLMESYNLLVLSEIRHIFRHSSGKPIDQRFGNELLNIIRDIKFKANVTDAKGLTAEEYTDQEYNKVINERYGQNEEQLAFATEFSHVINKYRILGGLTDIFNLNESTAECAGDQLLSWNGHGYKTFLDRLMKIYPNSNERIPVVEKTLFSKEVVKIQWKNDISVECSDSTRYSANHVIVTASLGVLKHRHGGLFNPRLPKEKVHAIQELGMGACLKVFLHFPIKWWTDANMEYTKFIWSEEDRSDILSTVSDNGELGQSWILDMHSLHITDKNPHVLETWFAGKTVPKIELFSDDKIMDGVMIVCEKFFRVLFPNLTRPDYIIRENWYSNPNFRGTYSSPTLESLKRDISGAVALSQPLFTGNGAKSLLFAGEATHPKYYATVHGAVETGFREAERIINFYR